MTTDFPDHFSAMSADYADYRPTYPAALYEWLASIAPGDSLAWDCATGSGQAAVGLAAHFRQVVGTDASEAQIAAAVAHPKVTYRVGLAQESGLAGGSADVVTVAQAMHWLDLPAFYTEVHRVLKPEGILAVWCYWLMTIEGETIDAVAREFCHGPIDSCWPPEGVHVESAYRDLSFPFTEVAAPAFTMTASWTLAALIGYIRTWSATARFIKQNGFDPTTALEQELAPLWGPPDRERVVTWPLTLRVGRL